jgi:hypothetical protein
VNGSWHVTLGAIRLGRRPGSVRRLVSSDDEHGVQEARFLVEVLQEMAAEGLWVRQMKPRPQLAAPFALDGTQRFSGGRCSCSDPEGERPSRDCPLPRLPARYATGNTQTAGGRKTFRRALHLAVCDPQGPHLDSGGTGRAARVGGDEDGRMAGSFGKAWGSTGSFPSFAAAGSGRPRRCLRGDL